MKASRAVDVQRQGTGTQQLPCQQPPWGELAAVNVNTGEIAWKVPLGVTDSLAGRQAEHRPSGKWRHDRDRRRAGLCRRDGRCPLPRFRRQDRQRTVDREVAAARLRPLRSPIEGRDGRQYVVITATGGGFFSNPVTDDSVVAFALDDPKEASSSRPVPRPTP